MNTIGAIIISAALIALAMFSVVRDKTKKEMALENNEITDWVEHIAKTTGRINRIVKSTFKTPGYEYTEYEIVYEVNGVTYHKWFDLYPGPDLGDIYGEGASVLIKYSESDPDEFEVISVLGDSNIMMF